MVAKTPDLESLIRERFGFERKDTPEPHGRRSMGNEVIERSHATGWTHKAGSTGAQELRFSNGYTVLAVQVEGQKAVIKGPGAWLGLLKAIEQDEVQECVREWLQKIANAPPTRRVPVEEPKRRDEPSDSDGAEDRMASLEDKIETLLNVVEKLTQSLQKPEKTQ